MKSGFIACWMISWLRAKKSTPFGGNGKIHLFKKTEGVQIVMQMIISVTDSKLKQLFQFNNPALPDDRLDLPAKRLFCFQLHLF